MELEISDFDKLYPYKLKSKKPTAIMFKASWCGHCKVMTPIWNQARERILFVNIYTYTVDTSPEKEDHLEKINNSLEKGKIDGFPTFLFYSSDGKISKLEGSGITFDQILEKCKKIS